MPDLTANYRLAKPGYGEPVDVMVINSNMDAIDAGLARCREGGAELTLATNQQILALFGKGDESDA